MVALGEGECIASAASPAQHGTPPRKGRAKFQASGQADRGCGDGRGGGLGSMGGLESLQGRGVGREEWDPRTPSPRSLIEAADRRCPLRAASPCTRLWCTTRPTPCCTSRSPAPTYWRAAGFTRRWSHWTRPAIGGRSGLLKALSDLAVRSSCRLPLWEHTAEASSHTSGKHENTECKRGH
jgi:hypothetical protein